MYLLTQDGDITSIQLMTANLPRGLNLTCVIAISIIAVGPGRKHKLTFRTAAANVIELEGSLQCPLPNEEAFMEEGKDRT